METFIVILIVGVAAVYCIRNVIKRFKGESSCTGNCSCGSGKTNCEISENNFQDFVN